jgi:hypothetical protein
MYEYDSTDNLHQFKESFYVVLDSRNATGSENTITSMHSCVYWDLKEPIRIEKKFFRLTCNLCSFISPASFYQINYTNNTFNFTMNSVNYNIQVSYGNYNANTFITQFLSQLPTGFTMTINTNNNLFTLKYTTYNFVIDCKKSTIGNVMGFNSNNFATLNNDILPSTLSSISLSLTFPYTCNFAGLQSFNIYLDDVNTKNIDSINLSNCSVISSIPVDCNLGGLIVFQSRGEYEFSINQGVLDYIQISLKDDLGNYLDLNNQNFNVVLQFNLYGEDVKRYIQFHDILKPNY